MEKQVIKTACEVFGISEAELFNHTIRHAKTKLRMAISYILMQQGIEQKEIAMLLDKHQTTVSYYVSIANDLIEYDKDFKNKVTQIMEQGDE